MLVIRRMTTALLAGHLLLLVGVGTTCCSIKTVMFPLLADAFAPQPSRRNAHRQQWRSNQCISQGTDVVDNGVRTCSVLNGFLGGGAQAKIPKTVSERNQQIVQSVQAALKSPRTPSVRLIECEFPVLALLNKQGDGSLSSSTAVDDANLVTAKLLVQSLTSPLSSLFSLGTAAWLLTSTGASNTLQRKASATVGKGGALVHSLKDGLPRVKSRDVCVLLSPCTSADYSLAKQLVANGNAVVLVNGIAKDNKSVSGDATMAYYLKPLTYNSNRVGYLVRSYPGPWTVLYDDSYSRIGSDSSSNRKGATITNRAVVLATVSDAEILVPGTNTPDLRGAGRLVQKAVGERDSRNR